MMFVGRCHHCGESSGARVSCRSIPFDHGPGLRFDPLPVTVMDEGIFCPDCGAPVGGYHHAACEREICPRCGDRAQFCECNGEFTPPLGG